MVEVFPERQITGFADWSVKPRSDDEVLVATRRFATVQLPGRETVERALLKNVPPAADMKSGRGHLGDAGIDVELFPIVIVGWMRLELVDDVLAALIRQPLFNHSFAKDTALIRQRTVVSRGADHDDLGVKGFAGSGEELR